MWLMCVFLTEAVGNIISFLGMQPCERSDKVPENKNSHVLFLAGRCWKLRWMWSQFSLWQGFFFFFFLQIKCKYLMLGCLVFLGCYLLLLVIWLAFPPSPLRCVSGRSWRAGSSSPGAGWRRHYAGDSSQQRRDSCWCHPGIRGLNTHAAALCQHNHEMFHLSDTSLGSFPQL